jgi:mono/diheme cytochrome c family protein
MPHFYGQSTNNQRYLEKEFAELSETNKSVKDQSAYPDAELYSIAWYIQTESAKHLGGEDSTRELVREQLAAQMRKLQAAVTTVEELQSKQRLTAKEKMDLSEQKSKRAKLKKDLDAAVRRYRDLSLMSRPMHANAINERADQLQELLDRSADPLSKNEIEELFGKIGNTIRQLKETSTPLAVQGKKEYLIDSTGKPIPFAQIPNAEKEKEKDAKKEEERMKRYLDGGKNLFIEKGCLACHSHTQAIIEHKIDEDKVPLISDAHFAPELSRIASKLHPDRSIARTWLTQWVLNPNIHHPRTRMPLTHLSVAEAAQIADWLLAASETWKPEEIKKPDEKILKELASLSLVKVPIIGRQNTETVLKEGLTKFLNTLTKDQQELLAADADERLLEGALDESKLMRYVGKKAISRQGCFGCHDIPGFENSKPIGTALNDWGKKDPERLAFEDAEAFLDRHFNIAELRDAVKDPTKPEEKPRPDGSWMGMSSGKVYEKYFADALRHKRREGFLSLKLAEPRSYDYGRVRDWDDRLRMPQFKFARTHRRGEEGKMESLEAYRKRRDLEGEGKYDGQTQFEEARAREAVMTFILGLVAENIPLKFVNAPKTDRLAEVRGHQILEKFNCIGCHEVRSGVYEFNLTPKSKDGFLSEIEGFSDLADHVFPESNAWTGRPSPIPGQYTVFGVSPDDHSVFKKDENIYQIRLTEAFRFTDRKGVTRHRPAGEALRIPADSLIARSQTFGGDFARLVGPHLRTINERNYDKREDQRSALPPPLLREGERAQPAWLFNFLRDPSPIRPTKWMALRMPKFNMTDEEARGLVEYFAAVDKMTNPGINLNEAFAEVPQRDPSYWQEKNKEYLKNLNSNAALKKHFDEGAKDLATIWKHIREDEAGQLKRQRDRIKEDLDRAAADKKDYFKKQLDTVDKKLKEIDDAKEDQKELEKFVKKWTTEQVYTADAYRVLTTPEAFGGWCMQCHSIGDLQISVEKGPNLDLAADRLRPGWTQQWIANPRRLFTYTSIMPQNFPNDKPATPHYLEAPTRMYPEALRDVLMNFPEISKLPVNRYRLAPKGGK